MNKTNSLRSFMSVLLLMLASQFLMLDASATPTIFGQAAGAGISLTAACQTCHTGASGSESKGNLKTGYQAAYNADKTNLTALKIKINGCPTGQVPNTAGTACVAPPPPPPAPCVAPKQVINGVCTLPPPPPPAPCVAPKQVINGVCTLPPPPPPAPCVLPKKVINGVCTLPPPPPPAPCVLPKKVINGVCTLPPPPPPAPCVLPKKVINGVCTIPPVACNDEEDDDEDDHDHDSKSGKCGEQITQSGSVGEKRTGKARTDVYAVTCATGTSYLSVSVSDLAPVKASMISIQTTKGTASSALSTDDVDGDANHSPLVKLAGGAGVYMMKINKSASSVAGAETYSAQFHCRNAAGINTGTKWEIKQNR